jgi:hypothetical protein
MDRPLSFSQDARLANLAQRRHRRRRVHEGSGTDAEFRDCPGQSAVGSQGVEDQEAVRGEVGVPLLLRGLESRYPAYRTDIYLGAEVNSIPALTMKRLLNAFATLGRGAKSEIFATRVTVFPNISNVMRRLLTCYFGWPS